MSWSWAPGLLTLAQALRESELHPDRQRHTEQTVNHTAETRTAEDGTERESRGRQDGRAGSGQAGSTRGEETPCSGFQSLGSAVGTPGSGLHLLLWPGGGLRFLPPRRPGTPRFLPGAVRRCQEITEGQETVPTTQGRDPAREQHLLPEPDAERPSGSSQGKQTGAGDVSATNPPGLGSPQGTGESPTRVLKESLTTGPCRGVGGAWGSLDQQHPRRRGAQAAVMKRTVEPPPSHGRGHHTGAVVLGSGAQPGRAGDRG